MTFEYTDLIGKPFRFGGRGPTYWDCWGVVRECLRRQGLTPPEYPSTASGETNSQTFADAAPKWERLAAPEVGAVVTFRMNSGMASHCGVMVSDTRFLHIMEKTHVVIERLNHPLWVKRMDGFFRWPEGK